MSKSTIEFELRYLISIHCVSNSMDEAYTRYGIRYFCSQWTTNRIIVIVKTDTSFTIYLFFCMVKDVHFQKD